MIVDAPETIRPRLKPVDDGANVREPVDPAVPEEALVLRGEDRVDDMARHLFQRQLTAEALGHARFAQGDPVPIEQRDALHWRSQQGAGGIGTSFRANGAAIASAVTARITRAIDASLCVLRSWFRRASLRPSS